MDLLKGGSEFKDLDIWTRSLQPKTLDDVIGNDIIRKILKNYCSSGSMPNILLTGPHGTCKRTMAQITINSYLKHDAHRGSLHIEGAVFRGKDTISNASQKKTDKLSYTGTNVLEFSRTKISLPEGRHRIVVIYNFEDMLVEAQNALRRIMETQSKTTRFILIANKLDDIIEAIQSRCITLKTTVLSDQEAEHLLHTIAPCMPETVVRSIVMLSEGDAKRIINYAQTASAATDLQDEEIFYRIFNIPSGKLLKQALVSLDKPESLEIVTCMLDRGYNYNDILEMLVKIIPRHEGLSLEQKVTYINILAKYFCWLTAMVSPVHLYALFSEFADTFNGQQA